MKIIVWNQPLEIGLCNKAVGTSKKSKENRTGVCINTVRSAVESTMKKYEDDIKRLDPNASIGYRGSLASGYKNSITKGEAPFNSNDFDFDAFIISEYLANDPTYTNRRRDGSEIAEIKTIEDKIDSELRSKPCLKGMRSESFGFRIFKNHELDDLSRKGDIQKRL
ncbi:hypothetical protein I6M90_17475 [Acinetobacter bereziniae]|uniref:hypothetical protein n=1 Tax=Acinetobacter bereziniae TaxID=106648 RepID=UPI001901C5AD|nr:hypothetical protein [Acinetobacter bereziniae]MBJ8452322.1 hypothetical protein [Acinetobacter bereziniae]MBJ8457843.1 hypothetical protein [Acinetobacter bereziniae]